MGRVQSRKPMPWHCKDCRRYFSVKYGTVMQSSKLGLQTWLLAMYLMMTDLKGKSSLKLHRDLGVTQKTAWHLAHRIREGMKIEDFDFCGPVEVDEGYIGGKEKNKHRDKRMKAAGGTVGKAILVGIKDRCSNRVSVRLVPDAKAATLTKIVADHVEPGTQVFSDETGANCLWSAWATTTRRSRTASGSTWTGWPTRTGSSRTGRCSGADTTASTTRCRSSTCSDTRTSSRTATMRGPRTRSSSWTRWSGHMDRKQLTYEELISNGTWARRRAERELAPF